MALKQARDNDQRQSAVRQPDSPRRPSPEGEVNHQPQEISPGRLIDHPRSAGEGRQQGSRGHQQKPTGDRTQPESDSQTAQRTQPRRGGQPPASGSHADKRGHPRTGPGGGQRKKRHGRPTCGRHTADTSQSNEEFQKHTQTNQLQSIPQG